MRDPRTDYEEAFAGLVEARAVRAFGLGRQGLVVLLRALGVRDGQRVGICGFTCLSVPEAVLVAGGEPVYLDVDGVLCIDPGSLRTIEPGGLDVLIVQHTFGLPGRLDELLAGAERIGCVTVEDVCHALGGTYKTKRLGTFAKASIYSSQWGKHYSTGQGGLLAINDAALVGEVDAVIDEIARPMDDKEDIVLAAQRTVHGLFNGASSEMVLRRIYAKLSKLGLVKGSFSRELDCSLEGYVRLAGPRICDAGLRQLGGWEQNKRLRMDNSYVIAEAVERIGLPRWAVPVECEPVMLRYPMYVRGKRAVLANAEAARIDLAGWYESPVHPLSGEGLRRVKYNPGACPASEGRIRELVHLPTGRTFSRKMLNRAMEIVARIEQDG